MVDVDGTKYTMHGRYNTETKRPYVEIKKDGEHYCYAPFSMFKDKESEV